MTDYDLLIKTALAYQSDSIPRVVEVFSQNCYISLVDSIIYSIDYLEEAVESDFDDEHLSQIYKSNLYNKLSVLKVYRDILIMEGEINEETGNMIVPLPKGYKEDLFLYFLAYIRNEKCLK